MKLPRELFQAICFFASSTKLATQKTNADY
jgi:hypothetical protein